MNESNRILLWAEDCLASQKNLKIINTQKIVQTSYSAVYKIQTNQGDFYLKKTPKDLFLEPDVINFLNMRHCMNVPNFVAKNDLLNCFLMTSCGNESLRHLFKGNAEINQIGQGINNFTKIQRALENNLSDMLSIQMPDWQLNKFPLLYHQLILEEKLLLDDGMTKQEIDQLHLLEGPCTSLCNELLNFGIPETINHNDFHENNMILDKPTGNISIIDWGKLLSLTHFFH